MSQEATAEGITGADGVDNGHRGNRKHFFAPGTDHLDRIRAIGEQDRCSAAHMDLLGRCRRSLARVQESEIVAADLHDVGARHHGLQRRFEYS